MARKKIDNQGINFEEINTSTEIKNLEKVEDEKYLNNQLIKEVELEEVNQKELIIDENLEKQKIDNSFIVLENHEKLNRVFEISKIYSKEDLLKKLGLKWFHILKSRKILKKYGEE